jgi:hypothetical protein
VITSVPGLTLYTIPLVLPIVATPVLPLLHTPPPDPSVIVIVDPEHTTVGPPITPGASVTLIIFVIVQPVPSEYVIVTSPVSTPVTIPDEEPTVARAVLLLVHVPPVTVSVSVTDEPTHTVAGPVITVGDGLTFIVVVAVQPAGEVYVITVLVRRVTPVTAPEVEFTVAPDGLLLTHVPAPVDALSNIVDPAHTAVAPLIVGVGLIATTAVPPIVLVQPVAGFVATTVYVPAAVRGPKSSAEPVPERGKPVAVAPMNNW